ncbi:MAG: helix-turn-helix domain-containing protein [Firmicutes bacterium]|nr:helix-turn-helix domain-containing protein [Bacillota bacterium]
MLSNQILKETIDGLYSISKVPVFVYDIEGNILASCGTRTNQVPDSVIVDFVDSKAESMSSMEWQYFKAFDEGSVEYVIALYGQDESNYRLGKIMVLQLQGLLQAYRERFDRDNFIKNLLLDNMLLVDIYMRAGKLHVDNNVPRVVCLIESNNDSDTNSAAMDVIRNLFPVKSKDFITAVDENNIILVKDLSEEGTSEDAVSHVTHTVLDTLNSETLGRVRVASGSLVYDLKDISKSYKEAKMALDVGKIFYEDKFVIDYNRLGIGRLIYQLPVSLCKMYIEEIFKDIRIEDFDDETLNTINKFFENSLNVSETSRQLYIHRNTLVYRLDKLQKNTGLDIRVFDDAITFKIALMVAKYMAYKEKNGF